MKKGWKRGHECSRMMVERGRIDVSSLHILTWQGRPEEQSFCILSLFCTPSHYPFLSFLRPEKDPPPPKLLVTVNNGIARANTQLGWVRFETRTRNKVKTCVSSSSSCSEYFNTSQTTVLSIWNSSRLVKSSKSLHRSLHHHRQESGICFDRSSAITKTTISRL